MGIYSSNNYANIERNPYMSLFVFSYESIVIYLDLIIDFLILLTNLENCKIIVSKQIKFKINGCLPICTTRV